ncbi:MAG TPA: helix-turn-helix domain-containing protein, partial [Bryobacteraceae bacterium]|nr:helix-turn-helix domain-containing protein [Bryobacteraceae bacterium]
EIRVPPLRERVDDIPALCEYFLSASGCQLREDALELLTAYSWPGNVRELRNILNKAVVFADSPVLTPADLPAAMQQSAAAESGYSLERLEEQAIFRALEQTRGHQQKAADILGISRRTLIRKLKHYGPLKSRHTPGRKSGPGVAL